MAYILALIFPPLAVLIKGSPSQALVNVGFCMLGWIPGIIHALIVVAASRRNCSSASIAQSHTTIVVQQAPPPSAT